MIVTFSIVKPQVPMTQEKVNRLRERLMENMRIRGMGSGSQKASIRALMDYTKSPGTAEPDDLRGYQLHMADTGVTSSAFNARMVALGFFLTHPFLLINGRIYA